MHIIFLLVVTLAFLPLALRTAFSLFVWLVVLPLAGLLGGTKALAQHCIEADAKVFRWIGQATKGKSPGAEVEQYRDLSLILTPDIKLPEPEPDYFLLRGFDPAQAKAQRKMQQRMTRRYSS